MQAFKFGISSWSNPWSIGVAKGPQPKVPLTALGLLNKAKELGVNLVQFADNLPLEKLTESELVMVKTFADTNKIDIEVGTKGIEKDHLLQFLKLAQFFHSPILRTLPALFGKKAEIKEVANNLIDVLPLFKKAGVTIVLENTEAFKAEEYAKLMKHINHPNLKMCIDPANALGIMEGYEHVLETLLPFCGNYHFKDIEVVRSQTLMGFAVNGKPSGQGQLPFPRILNQLVKHKLKPSIIIVLWPPLQETMEETIALENDWVKQSVEYLRSILHVD